MSKHANLSRRVLLQNGLAGGLVLAFPWPLRAAPVNEPEQAPDNPRRASSLRTLSSVSTMPVRPRW